MHYLVCTICGHCTDENHEKRNCSGNTHIWNKQKKVTSMYMDRYVHGPSFTLSCFNWNFRVSQKMLYNYWLLKPLQTMRFRVFTEKSCIYSFNTIYTVVSQYKKIVFPPLKEELFHITKFPSNYSFEAICSRFPSAGADSPSDSHKLLNWGSNSTFLIHERPLLEYCGLSLDTLCSYMLKSPY